MKEHFDSLTLFHHYHDFESRIHHLLLTIDMPKETELGTRFKKIVDITNDEFYHDLMYHDVITEPSDKQDFSRPKLLLHIFFFLECTDSIATIAKFLEISEAEVSELILELHNTFSIETLRNRIRAYYEHNKHSKERLSFEKREEYLGYLPAHETRDTLEHRRQRLRRKYGHADKTLIPDEPI